MTHEDDRLSLRSGPRPVTRFNRKMIIMMSAVLSMLLIGVTFYGLSPKDRSSGSDSGKELYNVERKPIAEGLDALPDTYVPAVIKPAVPELGHPLPGDLGSVLLEAERHGGVLPFAPDPVADEARAAHIRKQRRRSKAQEAGVFFTLSQKAGQQCGAMRDSQAVAGADFGRVTDVDPTLALLSQLAGGDKTPATNGKQAFLERKPDTDIYSAHGLMEPASPYQLMAGSIIAAHLMTGINSDLPGTVLAQISENIYDTVTGKHLLIPQGARLIGTYDSQTETGQERALVVWQRLIWPDGSSILLDDLPASDKGGYAGLKDGVDHHSGRLLRGITLATLLGVGTELAASDGDGRLIAALKNSAQSTAGDVGQRLVDRDLNIKPTITIRPGWPVRVITLRDLILKPYGSTP